MGKLKEELKKELSNLDLLPANSVGKLSQEDQAALKECFEVIGLAAGVMDQVQSNPDSITSGAAAATFGFILGHNWVKDHWALW